MSSTTSTGLSLKSLTEDDIEKITKVLPSEVCAMLITEDLNVTFMIPKLDGDEDRRMGNHELLVAALAVKTKDDAWVADLIRDVFSDEKVH